MCYKAISSENAETSRDEVNYFAQWLPPYPDVFITEGSSMFDSCYTARSKVKCKCCTFKLELGIGIGFVLVLPQIHFQTLMCSLSFPELSLLVYKMEIFVLSYYSSRKHLEILWQV